MTTLFLVNDARDLDATPATAALVRAAAARGPTAITTAVDLTADDAGFRARVVPLATDGTAQAPVELGRSGIAVVLVRSNPMSQRTGWAWAHALSCLEVAERDGLPVHNTVAALRRFAAKPGLMHLSTEVRPPTVVTGFARAVRAAVQAFGRSVVKPAHGSQGAGVFIVDPDSANLGATIDLLLTGGPVVVQPWLSAAVDGDVRIFVCDGEPFAVEGRVAAIRRRPAAGELRSNVHLGGRPEPLELSPALDALARRAAAELAAQGVRFAGIDCIGDRIVEVNACAPGGLQDMAARYGVDFVGGWLDRLVS